MNFVKEYERRESIFVLYHILNSLNATFSYPKKIDNLIHKLIDELYHTLDDGYPEYDIKSRKLIERIEFKK